LSITDPPALPPSQPGWVPGVGTRIAHALAGERAPRLAGCGRSGGVQQSPRWTV